jgi:hypothetical protein
MKGRRNLDWRVAACTVVCAALLGSVGAGAASAAPGDTFYLGKKNHVFVAFVVRSGASEIDELVWGMANVPCEGHRAPPKPQRFLKPFGTEPLVDGGFRHLWSEDSPRTGVLVGQADQQGFSGTTRARFYISRRGGTDATCRSGRREWSAKPVSEERWNAARESPFG